MQKQGSLSRIKPDDNKGIEEQVKVLPLEEMQNGPLRWNKRWVSTNERHYSDRLLSSKQGTFLVKSPCKSDWWKLKDERGDMSPCCIIKTEKGEYIMEGWTSAVFCRQIGGRAPFKTISIVDSSTKEEVATFDDISSVRMNDGCDFRIKLRFRASFVPHIWYEFIDKDGRSQFRIDWRRRIWIADHANRDHVLLLIAADRFIREVSWGEAPG